MLQVRSNHIHMLLGLKNLKHRKWLLNIFVMCLVFGLSLYRLASTHAFNDYVINNDIYGTDAIDYQLMAVNFVNGHGLTSHFIEDYPHYKIGVGKTTLLDTFRPTGFFVEKFLLKMDLHVWHPPGYPLFMAFIYKFVGISPFYIKFIQVILLALAASFMPLIGFLYWGELGVVSGMVASLVFINFCSPDPTLIRAEVLDVFLFSVWILLFTVWELMPRTIVTALLGIILGMTLLVKGTCVFIAFFFPIYLFFKLKNSSMAIKHALVFVFCVGVMVFPWSIYASIKTHEPVLLCTQTMPDLLAGNNERSIQTGQWTPDAQMKNPNFLYSKLKAKKCSDFKMLMVFFRQNYRHIPQLMTNKLRIAFPRGTSSVICSMLFYYAASFYFKRMNIDQALVPVFPLMFFINILLITLISYGRYIIVVPFIYPILMPGVYLPFYLARRFAFGPKTWYLFL